MNWLGGARNRIRGTSAESRKQKEFFERKRLASRVIKASLPHNTPTTRKRKVSRDILNLQCVRETKRPATAPNTDFPELSSNFSSRSNRFVNHMNLDAAKKSNSKFPVGIVTSRKYKEQIYLPNASPCKIPSSLDFADATDDEFPQTRRETFKHLPTYQSTPLDRFRIKNHPPQDPQAFFHPSSVSMTSYESCCRNVDQANQQSGRAVMMKPISPVFALQKCSFSPFTSRDNRLTTSSRKKVNFSYIDQYYSNDESGRSSSKDPHSEYDISFKTFENDDKKSPDIKHISPVVKQESISSPGPFRNRHLSRPEISLHLTQSPHGSVHAGEHLFSPFRGQSGPFFSSSAGSKCNGDTVALNTKKYRSPVLQSDLQMLASSQALQTPRWKPHPLRKMASTTGRNADLVTDSPSYLFPFSSDKLTPRIMELSPASRTSEKSCHLDTLRCISNPSYESNNERKSSIISDSYCQSSPFLNYQESCFTEIKNLQPHSNWIKQDNGHPDQYFRSDSGVDYTPFVKLDGKRKSLSDSLNRRMKNETACSISESNADSFNEFHFFSKNDRCKKRRVLCKDGSIEPVEEREMMMVAFQDENISPLDDMVGEKESELTKKTETVVSSRVLNETDDEIKYTGNNKDSTELNVTHLQTSSTAIDNCQEKQIESFCREKRNEYPKLVNDSGTEYTHDVTEPPLLRIKNEKMLCPTVSDKNDETNIVVINQTQNTPVKNITKSEREIQSPTADHNREMGFEVSRIAENDPALKYSMDQSYGAWELYLREIGCGLDKQTSDKLSVPPVNQCTEDEVRRLQKNKKSPVAEKHDDPNLANSTITIPGMDKSSHLSLTDRIRPIKKQIRENSDNIKPKPYIGQEIHHTADVALSPIAWPMPSPVVTANAASQTDFPLLLIKDTNAEILNFSETKCNLPPGSSNLTYNDLCARVSSQAQTSESSESEKVSNDEAKGRRRSLRKKKNTVPYNYYF